MPVKPNSRDELGEMAESFNVLQDEVRKAAISLGEARDKMQVARAELIARHEQIAFLAHHDPLTKLANRPALGLALDRLLDQAKAGGDGFALLSVDLDDFKEANDVFGHVVGDELLCAVARRLERAVGKEFIASAATNLSFSLRRANSPSRQRSWPSACSRRSLKTSISARRKSPSG
jgi:predicted signal transduction protein with EAL and GGDEF domain